MNANNSQKDLDGRLHYLSERLKEEFEVVKRQGFPSRKEYSQYKRSCDVSVISFRWSKWCNEMGVDFNQLVDLLKILETDGLLEDYEFVSEYM